MTTLSHGLPETESVADAIPTSAECRLMFNGNKPKNTGAKETILGTICYKHFSLLFQILPDFKKKIIIFLVIHFGVTCIQLKLFFLCNARLTRGIFWWRHRTASLSAWGILVTSHIKWMQIEQCTDCCNNIHGTCSHFLHNNASYA